MVERENSAPDPEWIGAVIDLCFQGYVPHLPVASVWNGLNLPDAKLDALCESIFAHLGREGGSFDHFQMWRAVLNASPL